jgi:hypothetical protein
VLTTLSESDPLTEATPFMTTLALLLLLALGVVCLGIPITAAVVVHRDELPGLWDGVRRALAFDPRHAALDPQLNR